MVLSSIDSAYEWMIKALEQSKCSRHERPDFGCYMHQFYEKFVINLVRLAAVDQENGAHPLLDELNLILCLV